jgi:hypothetical protein
MESYSLLSGLGYSEFNNTPNDEFSFIKPKLCIAPLNEIDDSQIDIIKEKYSTDSLLLIVKKFKEQVRDLYNQREDLKDQYSQKNGLFKNFESCITQLLSNQLVIDDSSEFKEVLLSKQEEYYIILNLESIKEKVVSINEELSILNESIKEVMSLQDSSTCSVCMETRVEYFMNPCGHTLCGKCKGILKSKCHYCRTEITEFKKLFLF